MTNLADVMKSMEDTELDPDQRLLMWWLFVADGLWHVESYAAGEVRLARELVELGFATFKEDKDANMWDLHLTEKGRKFMKHNKWSYASPPKGCTPGKEWPPNE